MFRNTLNNDLLFFTVATGKHKIFVLPYIFFALWNNKNACAEILVYDSLQFVNDNRHGILELNKIFKNRFIIREAGSRDGATLRFKEEPKVKCKLTYIGDIDILIMESNVYETHRKIIKGSNGLISGKTRGKSKITGLVCVKTDPWYKRTKAIRRWCTLRDEKFIFKVVEQCIGNPHEYMSKIRPAHGFHLSLNREPLGKPGWKMRPRQFQRDYLKLKMFSEWKAIYPYFDEQFKELLTKLESYFDV